MPRPLGIRVKRRTLFEANGGRALEVSRPHEMAGASEFLRLIKVLR